MTKAMQAMLDEAAQDTVALAEIVASTPADAWDVVREGEWTARQILVHLADAELVFGYRLRTALATPGQPITPFDQDAWASEVPAASVPIDLIAGTFISLRNHHVAILRSLPADSLQRTIDHPEYGAQTLEEVCGLFLPHSTEHVQQLHDIL